MHIVVKRIKRFFKKELFKIEVLNGLDDPRTTSVLKKIKNKSVDGFLIKNALEHKSVELLKDYYFSLEKIDGKTNTEIAGTYPTSFITKMYSRSYEENYFLNNKRFADEVTEKSGFNLKQYFIDTLSLMNNNNPVVYKQSLDGKGWFAPFQFRSLRKNGGDIHLHCENCHQSWAPELNDQLGDQKLQPNAIPYFITLQESKGGKIVLFDVKWEPGQTIVKKDNGYFNLVLPNGNVLNCSPGGIPRIELDTEPGDLFIFNGGEIWHMVESALGENKRITVGGFLNTTKNNQVEMWA